MTRRDRILEKDDLDGLRLFALGRISRCAGCARYHSLVAAHGGTIAISDRPGGGARFTFTLPADGEGPPPGAASEA